MFVNDSALKCLNYSMHKENEIELFLMGLYQNAIKFSKSRFHKKVEYNHRDIDVRKVLLIQAHRTCFNYTDLVCSCMNRPTLLHMRGTVDC